MPTIKSKTLLVSHYDGGKLHMYILPGQMNKDGVEFKFDLRVQCDQEVRNKYPAWTLFAIPTNEITLDSRGTHYKATSSTVEVVSSAPSVGKCVLSDWGEEYRIAFDPAISSSTSTGDMIITVHASSKEASYRFNQGVRPTKWSGGVYHDFAALGDEYVELINPIKVTTVDLGDDSTDPIPEPEPEPLSWIDQLIQDEKIDVPTPKKDGFFMSTSDWKLLVRNIKRHTNTLITGPAGTGKTSCVRQAANKLGLPLYIFDMGAMIDPISSLLGVHRLKEGKSVFDYAQFTKAVQEPCIILLDEINRAPMGVGNILFPCLDDRRTLPVEIACGEEMRSISIHPEVTFIATANIGAEYTGTMTIDRALQNRFFPLELDHLPKDVEKEVLIERTGIDRKSAESIVKVANDIRMMHQKVEVSCGVSIRETLMISSLITDGWRLGEAMKSVYLPMYEGTQTEGERGKLFKLLASY